MDLRRLLNQLNEVVEQLEEKSQNDKLNFDDDYSFDQPKSFEELFENTPLFKSKLNNNNHSNLHNLLYDVEKQDENVVVVVDLPGFSEDNISLQADERQIRIDAESTEDMRRESVSHTFRLPVEVIPSEAEATFENGVLTVTLPREEIDDDDHTKIDIS